MDEYTDLDSYFDDRRNITITVGDLMYLQKGYPVIITRITKREFVDGELFHEVWIDPDGSGPENITPCDISMVYTKEERDLILGTIDYMYRQDIQKTNNWMAS